MYRVLYFKYFQESVPSFYFQLYLWIHPSTGEKALYGEYLMNAQGEDVVAGIRTPQPIKSLENENQDIYAQFIEIANRLEAHYRDMQDIEFTIERGRLYILQTRNGKRTAPAAIRVAVELCREGVISKEEAITRIEPGQLGQLLHRRMDTEAKLEVIAKGLPASPGAASGKIVFDANEAERLGILVKKSFLFEQKPDEIAPIADFFSFGTNDLTQTTLGFSRDDAEGKFLPAYLDKNILEQNPFAVLDRNGVGKLMKLGVQLGRAANPNLKVGICGEHGGESSSIEFCHLLGLHYVSCSPFRVPIARLAAAQAAVKHQGSIEVRLK
jgi:phosphoenolpyruvate synthase/pyruvate phosphate dikinase